MNEVPHGTAGGYTNHRCRCVECRRAWSLHISEYRTKRDNPKKFRARAAAQYYIHRGDLVPEPCEVCGALEVQAHHDDYDKPLNLRWLCREHHSEEEDGRGASPHVYIVGVTRSYVQEQQRRGIRYNTVLVREADGTIVRMNTKKFLKLDLQNRPELLSCLP